MRTVTMHRGQVLRAWLATAFVLTVILMLTAGCGSLGLVAKIQEADEALAAKNGVPKEFVAKARKFIGMPDARTIPPADRVLPEPFYWHFDLLDKNGIVLDTTGWHYGDIPRIERRDKLAPSTFIPPAAPPSSTATEDDLEKFLKEVAPLMKGATP